MKTFITGGSGLLGCALAKMPELGTRWAPTRAEFDLASPTRVYGFDKAFLCAGTKGFAPCEGNWQAFRADVDGNIKLARWLLQEGTFVVFVSTDAVEVALNTSYARNRYLVEAAIGGFPRVAIFRPGKFDASNVHEVARACANAGEGLTRWP